MALMLTPPDFFRLLEIDGVLLSPPPLPAPAPELNESLGTAAITYTQFGAQYSVPPAHVAELKDGFSRVYDPSCLIHHGADSTTTYRSELHKLASALKHAIRTLLQRLAEDRVDEPGQQAVSEIAHLRAQRLAVIKEETMHVRNLFANISHLLAHLRRLEAISEILQSVNG
jgi:hypothetical protein